MRFHKRYPTHRPVLLMEDKPVNKSANPFIDTDPKTNLIKKGRNQKLLPFHRVHIGALLPATPDSHWTIKQPELI